MRGERISWIGLSAVVLLSCVSVVTAAPPWETLLTFNRVEADREAVYRLSEDNGPWMIMACSFSGEQAEQQAQELVYELRKRYKLETFVHQARFDLEDAQGRGLDQFDEPVKMRYRRGSEVEEVAVLVGNYPSVDDPDAQKTLQKLKYSRPESLKLEQGKSTSQSLAALRHIQKQILAKGSKKKQKGPMGHAFVTTNPLLPKEYFNAPGVDKLVLQMNKHVRHSLLDCPGKYTVQVATFKGKVIIDQKEIKEVQQGKKIKSELADAAEKAHKLTEALRMKGWEAYEFHDRHASIVTVGSFDSPGTPRADGKIEINPKVHAIMQTFGGQQTTIPGQPGGGTAVKSLIGIPLDIQPRPVHVPKRSISREMAGGLF